MADFDSLVDDSQKEVVAPKAPAFDELVDDSEKYSGVVDQAKTALEQGLSGATLGASKVLETKGIPALGIPPLTTAEEIAGREQRNPGTAFVSNLVGTGATLVGTGGLGAAAKGVGLAGRLALGALEGATIAGVNQATDDWSQNKALDAQKIAASAGIGALLGGVLGEVAGASKYKIGTPLAKIAKSSVKLAVEHSPAGLAIKGVEAIAPEALKQGLTDALSSTTKSFQKGIMKFDTQLNTGIRTIFTGAAAQTRQ